MKRLPALLATLLAPLACLGQLASQTILQENFDRGHSAFTRQPQHYDEHGVNGTRCLVFHGRSDATLLLSVPIRPQQVAGRRILLQAQAAGEHLQSPPQPHLGTKLTLYIRTADGKQTWLDAPKLTGDTPWHPIRLQATVPAQASDVQIQVGLQRCAGTLRLDDLSLQLLPEPQPPTPDRLLTVTGAIDQPSGLYRRGQPMTFSFQLLDHDRPTSGTLRLTRRGDDGQQQQMTVSVTPEQPATLITALDAPGFVMVKAELLDEQGQVPRRPVRPGAPPRAIQYGLGAAVEPEALRQATPPPDDFTAFWSRQRLALAQVPIRLLDSRPLRSTASVDILDIKVACLGDRPVSGYLTIPKDAAQGRKYPAHLRFDGYSVQSATAYETPDAITLSINPHGIENGREDDYYRKLRQGELANYGFRNDQNQSPDTSYFLHMILRALRAAEFLRQHPAWNGRDFHLIGSSQGAFQATAVAAQCPWATRLDIAIPWLCDLAGPQLGRIRGWRPDWTPALAYFDTTNFARLVQCPTAISAGSSDYICPPAGVQILYNNLTCDKRLVFLQGLDHATYPGFNRQTTPRYSSQHTPAP